MPKTELLQCCSGDVALTAQLGAAARADVAARYAPEVVAREVVTFLAPLCKLSR